MRIFTIQAQIHVAALASKAPNEMKLKVGGICIAVAERLRKITVDSDRRKQRIMHAKDRIERILDAGESVRILIKRCRARFAVVAGCIMAETGFYSNKRQ